MKKNLIILIVVIILVGGGAFYYGYSKAGKNRQYAADIEKIVNQIPQIPEVAESGWSSQVQDWEEAAKKVDELNQEAARLKTPEGSDKLASMFSELPVTIKDGVGEIKFLAFSEKVREAISMPKTKNREEAEREVTKAMERIETILKMTPAEEQGHLGPEFNEKLKDSEKAFDEYFNNLQKALADIKQGKSVTYLNTKELDEALDSLRKDVIASLKDRLNKISNLKDQIRKEKSRLFSW